MSGNSSRKTSRAPAKATLAALASESQRPAVKRKTDRRILQTRDALGDALVALMREKPFDSITVQQVLDRAGIGRSTFYSHYRDKDDLFFSDVEDFWGKSANAIWKLDDASHRVAPVRELFTHVDEVRDFYNALVSSGRLHDVMELGEGHFARSIEQRLAHFADRSAAARVVNSAPGDLSRRAMAHALAGAMFALLAWWINHGTPLSPAQTDILFHQLVWSGAAPRAAARPPARKQPGSTTG